MKTIALEKDEHRFYLSYEAGQELAVSNELVAMVKRREHGFDWFDAAQLSHQLNLNLRDDLIKFLPVQSE